MQLGPFHFHLIGLIGFESIPPKGFFLILIGDPSMLNVGDRTSGQNQEMSRKPVLRLKRHFQARVTGDGRGGEEVKATVRERQRRQCV